MKTNNLVVKSFIDDLGNTYRIEQAYNGVWVVMRYNCGGNRKLFKSIEPHKQRKLVVQRLNKHAELNGWSTEESNECL